MAAIFRETTFGQLVRWATKNKVFQYPEEQAGFQLPESYLDPGSEPTPLEPVLEKIESSTVGTPSTYGLASPATIRDDPLETAMSRTLAPTTTLSSVVTRRDLAKTHTRADLEAAFREATIQESLKKQPSRPIAPTKTADGIVLVDWYTTDDPENPQNWRTIPKASAALQIYLYTLAVYMGSSIVLPSLLEFPAIFGTSATVNSLGLALYVLGYGIGPLFFSPLSEIPTIGRNPPYMISFFVFVILSIPTALVNNLPGLLVLRFLQGFFGSPCLATGAATMSDIMSFLNLPYLLWGWAFFALGGPALGPLISGFSVPATNWHWSLYEILWLAAPTFLIMFFFLPETSTPTILLRRAERIRKLTGNSFYKSQSEIDQSQLSPSTIVYEALVIPWKVNALDPAILFTSVYIGILYAIFYSFFEVFPIVYMEVHHFSISSLGLVFLSVLISIIIFTPIYFAYLRYIYVPSIENAIATGIFPAPERRLIPAVYASFFIPIGLFIFAWTGPESSIHWIVPTIGIVIMTGSCVILFQCLFLYIALSYPRYGASLFAFNDFARASLAVAAVLWSGPLFAHLGIARGVTLLAGLTIGCIGGIFALFFFGDKLRARSKFAV